MFESIAVLLIFFIFVGLGLMFFVRAWKDKSREAGQKFESLEAIKVALVVSNLPELVCTNGEHITSTCFDKYKLMAFNELLNTSSKYKNEHYFNLFGYSSIIVEPIYPQGTAIGVYERKKPNTKGKQSFIMPIGLYDSGRKSTAMAVLKVEVYQ